MKAIVSVIGKDQSGIIANVSMALYKMDINIEDISQTIMQNNYFTMIMMIDLAEKSIESINENLQNIAKKMSVEITVRHEEIFLAMHRLK